MSPTTKIPAAILAALAAAALATPAGAMPLTGGAEYDAGHASMANRSAGTQDLRSPDAKDAAVHHRALGATPVGPPTWASHPQSLHAVQEPVKDDGGTPWTTIVLGVAGAGLAAGGAAGIARSSRLRVRRARVAA